jgi:hypothetical protein
MLKLLAKIAGPLGRMTSNTTLGMLAALSIVAAAIGAGIIAVFSALPDMPAVPPPPAGMKWLNWFIPVGQLVAIFSGFVTMYLTWLVVRVVGRWVKAI